MDLKKEVEKAISHFWRTRNKQTVRQGNLGRTDQGSRSAVTGGKQLDGFVQLTKKIVINAGIREDSIFINSKLELPGYYRPEKKWDLVVVQDEVLLAAVEFKSHIGPSFGNNYNNRTEEAIGNAQDIWTAYREGAFSTSMKPWLGFLMILEDSTKSTTPVAVREPHFPVFPEFNQASYADRYVILMTKLIRERLYDSACLLTSANKGKAGNYREHSKELTFNRFVASLSGHLATARKM